MGIKHFKTAEFDAAVAAAPLAMVDFWADWCGPCKMLSPVIESLADQYEGKVLVGKVNVDEEPDLARRFGVMSIPTVVFLKNGQEFDRKVEQFARLPGIGGKSAQRLAFYVLGLPEAEAKEFADAILDAKKSVTCCPVCQNFTAGGLCPICASPKRDGSVICVVADPRDVAAIERAREYNGRYHVLHGVISPMNHVGPDDLAIKSLVERVASGEVKEVIMATNPDTEGEATAMYIARLLKPFDVRVTRLAYGIPVGGHLEFADDATLMRALEGRREI